MSQQNKSSKPENSGNLAGSGNASNPALRWHDFISHIVVIQPK